jgi:hypothetical protein
MIGRMLPRVSRMACALLALTAVFAVATGTASAGVIYNNNVAPRNIVLLPSVGFEATSTAEFGGQVQFAGTPRTNATVTAIMSSWACQNLKGGAACSSAGGSSFNWPITLNVYAVKAENEPGAKLDSVTQEVTVPYRPSAAAHCPVETEGEGWGSKCALDKAFKVTFHLPAFTLPSKAILSIAYNTSDYGAEPTHAPSVGEDSLNLAVTEGGTEHKEVTPLVGSDPLPEYTYVNSTYAEMYEPEPHGAIGTFSLANGWTGFQPVFKVTAPAHG